MNISLLEIVFFFRNEKKITIAFRTKIENESI